MNLMTMRNIHAAAQTAPADHEITYRKNPRSPDEEFAARVAAHGLPAKFPQSVIALILQKQTRAEVKPNGIKITFRKTDYTFWHENSTTCADKRGERVLVTFDPDDMEFCHILTDDGRYVESLPQKNKVSWFDDEAMRKEMQKKGHALNRDMVRFQEIHKDTSEQKVQRVLSNAEKMQIVNPMPHPATAGERKPEAEFEKADRIERAGKNIEEQRGATSRRIQRTTERVNRLPDNDADADFWDTEKEKQQAEAEDYAATSANLDELDQLY